MYLVRTPWFLKKVYSSYFWNINTQDKIIYLTFDDGPHPTITNFVLDTLKFYNAKATFFCIGKNVDLYPNTYSKIIQQGHSVGNHTQSHLNGWKTLDQDYLNNIEEAALKIDSKLFRPPYGRITRFQAKLLMHAKYKIIMWDVLSGDFDISLSKEKCSEDVILATQPGSIVVFHDSEKAMPRLEYVLPKMLNFFNNKGYKFDAIKTSLFKQ